MIKYYPEEVNMSTFVKGFPDVGFVDLEEEQRLQDIIDKKKRGKGTPRKARTPRKQGCLLSTCRRSLTGARGYRGESQEQETTIDLSVALPPFVPVLLYHITLLIALLTLCRLPQNKTLSPLMKRIKILSAI